MGEVKITDLVDQSTIDQIRELNEEMQSLVTTYVSSARELAKGLRLPVDGIDSLERLEEAVGGATAKAASANRQLASAVERRGRVMAQTTPVISRELMELERVNKTQREAYTEHDRVKKLLDHFHDTYEGQVQSLVKLNRAIEENKKAQKDLDKQLSSGQITADKYNQRQVELITRQRALSQEKKTLTQVMTAEEKAAQSQETSYVRMSQQLELLKKAYKDLSTEGRGSDFGRELEESIQNLDAHLKDTAADMGEFQRNVGNYAIAGQNGVVSTESLTAALNQEARTQQDLVDQTKILEEAKLLLNKTDADYDKTVAAINARLEENKRKLTDVSDIMGKEARTVAEAEAQNKRLSEAMRHIDLAAEGSKKKLEEMRKQIEHNNSTIAEATGSNEKFADSMLGLIGVNSSFGSSIMTLESNGNFVDGLHDKVKSFGKTLTGLLANPWVLAFLGIAGIVAGFKWWYDYNKGLIEASRLTENFTGKTGEAADSVTAYIQTLADQMGKDFGSTISAANTLVQQFGLSWEEAGGKIQDAIRSGADMNGNLLANIERFAPALRDAGVSADEFVAILAETRNGIFNEQGIQNIVKAGTRLRAMTKQTEEALDAVGISAKKMQEEMASGNLSMIDAVKTVASKLKEIPENSQEAGQIMKNVFGRTAAEGGTLLIQSIADINTNIDKAKDGMGELGEANERQMKAQRELNETLMSVFKASGTSFETMVTNAKTFVNEGLTAIIKGLADTVNWCARLYDKSMLVRGALQLVAAMFKTVWTTSATFVRATIDLFKALGEVIEGVFDMDWEMVANGFKNGYAAIKKDVSQLFEDMAEMSKDFKEEITSGTASRIKIGIERDEAPGDGKPVNNGNDEWEAPGDGANDTVKNAKEQLKILRELEEAKIALMSESHQKELEAIRLNYQKKLDAIEGESENEKELRKALGEQMERELAESDAKYYESIAKTNLENRLATVREGSREELEIRIAILEQQRKKEVEAAEKSGADVLLVESKYNAMRQKLEEDFAQKQAEAVMNRYALSQVKRDKEYTDAVNALKKRYSEELKAAGDNSGEMERLREKLDRDLAALDRDYAEESAKASVDMLEEALSNENLSMKDREKLRLDLAHARMDLTSMEAEHEKQVAEEAADFDREMAEKRLANQLYWMNAAMEGLSALNDLAQTLYDAKITRIEDEQEANQDAGEKEQERITELVEKKVITEEEGEARKRASEAKTAKKEEELERKKAKIKHKQAIFNKAVNVAKIGMDTAAALMRLWVDPGWPAAIPLQAVVGAMGALQLATVLATPIPKYAKGTDSHKGGPAIVGDGGRMEAVVFRDTVWLTPDTPTLVEIPRGASVIPEVRGIDFPSMPVQGKGPDIVVNGYDDQDMRKAVRELASLIRQNTRDRRAIAARRDYETFKLYKGL